MRRLPAETLVEVSERELAQGYALTSGGKFYTLSDGHTDEDGVTWGVVSGIYDDEVSRPNKPQPERRIARAGRRRPGAKKAGRRSPSKRNGWSASFPRSVPQARMAEPGSSLWSARFVHKISPSAADVASSVSIPDDAWADRRSLGAALRKAGLLYSGMSVRSFRRVGDDVVVFPSRCEWHSITLSRL